MRFDFPPRASLLPYVASYWGFAREAGDAREFTLAPDRYLEFAFFDAPQLARCAGDLVTLAPCTLVPLLRSPLLIVLRDDVRCASIRIHAWAAERFGLAHAPTPPWPDLSPRFGDVYANVCEAQRCEQWSRIATHFDDMLGGTVLSREQLGDIARFQFVRDALWEKPRRRLAELALEAGYDDRAHLAREFLRYAGQSPNAYRARCAGHKAFLAGEAAAIAEA